MNTDTKKRVIFAIVLILVSILTTIIYFKNSDDNSEHYYGLRDSDKLFVVIERDTPGFIENNSLYYGYMFDIIREYAKYLERDLEITIVKNREKAINLLLSKEADLALMLLADKELNDYDKIRGFDIYDSDNYVILSSKLVDTTGKSIHEIIQDKKILISDGVDESSFYKKQKESSSAKFISNDNRFSKDLVSDLLSDKVDLLVCAERNAKIFLVQFNSLSKLFVADSNMVGSFYVDKNNIGLYDSFNNWYYNKYFLTGAQIYNEALYKTDLYINKIIKYGYLIPHNALTPLDYTFQKIGHQYKIDWELLAAIGLIESNFNPNAVSARGASGIMQIMPSMAKQFSVSKNRVFDIETNIETSAKLITDIKKSLGFKKEALSRDRIAIILACYNGGLGHVQDAINLSKKHGTGEKTWAEVSEYLSKKSEEQYYQDSVVNRGAFNASSTISFVNNVLKQYDNYKSKSNQLSANE